MFYVICVYTYMCITCVKTSNFEKKTGLWVLGDI